MSHKVHGSVEFENPMGRYKKSLCPDNCDPSYFKDAIARHALRQELESWLQNGCNGFFLIKEEGYPHQLPNSPNRLGLDWLFVEIDFSNMREIMKFVGLTNKKADEEMNFFIGGDSFIFTDVNGSDVELGPETDWKSGQCFVMKNEQGCYMLSLQMFKNIFGDYDGTKKTTA